MTGFNYFDSEEFKTGIKLSTAAPVGGSVNPLAVSQRETVYFDAIKNLETLEKLNYMMKNFDASSVENMAPSAMGIALAEAAIKAQINSIVGYVAIERSMTQMQQNLVYTDKVTKAGAQVMPMIGPDSPRARAQQKKVNIALTAATEYEVTLDACVAGSLSMTLNDGTTTHALMDDRKGAIMSTGIATGTINYATGALSLEFAAATTGTLTICYALNRTLGQGSNRTTVKQGYFQINANVNKFEYEADLITAMISQRTVGDDVLKDLADSVYDEQVISINKQCVDRIKEDYEGNTLTIDLSAFSVEGGFFDSMLKVLNAGLAAVDNEMAKRCYKAVAATAYICGNGAATLFMSLEDAQGWVSNTTGYVNDVIGFFKGRAVIRHLDLDDFECYAVHKTANGQLAPIGYGLLLPATALPVVGNFANINEVAGGIYTVDGVGSVAKPLAQRFIIKMSNDWMKVAA